MEGVLKCAEDPDWKTLVEERAENRWNCEINSEDYEKDSVAFLLFYSQEWYENCVAIKMAFDAVSEYIAFWKQKEHADEQVQMCIKFHLKIARNYFLANNIFWRNLFFD